MARNGFTPWFAVIASACFFLLSATARAEGDSTSTRQLTETMAKVRTGTSSAARTAAAEHLAELTRRIDPNKVDDASLAELVSLLDSPEDSVRYWVARCLGNLGSRARIAIPKLQKILAEVDCLRGSKTSASGIRLVLTQIGITPPPPKC
jgi:hypothetical protein